MTASTVDGASSGSIRGHNRSLVMKRVLEAGQISRTQIAAETGLTAAAISRITRELIDLKLLQEGAAIAEKGRPGRRSVELTLSPGGAYVIGIGAGAFEQWVRVSTLRGEVVARRELELMGLDRERAAEAIVGTVSALLDGGAFGSDILIGCGVAVAGVVDPGTGTIIASPNFGWRDFALGRILERALGLPTGVESLHHALNLAEASLGRTAGVDNVLLVNAALGIGASILADGRIVRGAGTAAGQIGHIPVEGVTEICTCGRRGCLDTVAAGHAVLTRLGMIPKREAPHEHEAGDPRMLKAAMDRAATGDAEANRAFREAGESLGRALAVVRVVTDPARIVLAGPLGQVESYVEGTRRALSDSRTIDEPLPPLLLSRQRNDAAGAWIALERFVFSDRLDPATFRVA